jgi:2-polyprenyl-3-methyl-5-hydroxy-6-metoxy-1,4-benzoquinol methylase
MPARFPGRSACAWTLVFEAEPSMPKKPTFDELIDEALAAPFEGWDFTWLDGRKTHIQLPWDYATRVRARMRGARAMLDMGTGGGEILASLAPFPPRVFATESYPPNVAVARKRLERRSSRPAPAL